MSKRFRHDVLLTAGEAFELIRKSMPIAKRRWFWSGNWRGARLPDPVTNHLGRNMWSQKELYQFLVRHNGGGWVEL